MYLQIDRCLVYVVKLTEAVCSTVNQQFSKEIEDEANSYFQRIYNHPPHPTISIDDVLDMLKRFKDSPVKKERVSIG